MRGPIARATIQTSAVLSLRLIAQAGTLLIVARLLGPEDFGVFAGITALAAMMGTMSTFGMHLTLLRELSKSPNRRDEMLPQALATTLTCGGLLFLIFLSAANTILPTGQAGLEILLCIGLAELLLQPLLLLSATEHQARGRIARSQILVTAPLFLRLCVALGVLAIQPPHLLEAYSMGYVCTSLLALMIANKTNQCEWPAIKYWRLPNLAEWRDSVSYAVLNLTALGPTELDKTLAVRLLPLATAGVYAASTRIVGAMILPVLALIISALPRLFRETDQRHKAQLSRWIFATSAGYGVAAAALLWAMSPLIEFMFGSQFQGITETLRYLAISVPGLALRIAAGGILMAGGRPWLRAGFEVIGLCFLFTTAIILTPKNEIYSMPVALACSEWSMAIIGWSLIIRNSLNTPPVFKQAE